MLLEVFRVQSYYEQKNSKPTKLLEVLRRGTAAWDGATGNDFRRRMMSDGEGFPLAGEITALARKILVWALRMKTPSGPRWG